LAYIFAAESLGLSSFKFVQWAPKHASFLQQCVLVVQGRSRSSKVNHFGTNRKRVCDFLILVSPSLWLWSYLAPFLRYGDSLAKNCLFLIPLSYSARSIPMFALEFRSEVNQDETRVMGLSSREDHMIVPGCDRQTDIQTDGQTESIIVIVQRSA